MANFNKVLLIGNLTRDPELRYTPQGTAVVNLRIAVNRRYRDRNQELKEEVCFVTAVVWNKPAEACNQYLHKGSQVFVEGRLQSRSWEDNTGKKRQVIEVRAERVQFLRTTVTKGETRPEESLPEETLTLKEEPSIKEEPSTETAWLEEGEDKLNEG